jgi:CBS domain-containing protein
VGGIAVREFADFLDGQPPYDRLEAAELERLARAVEIERFARGGVIVAADSEPLRHLWVIRSGSVEILDRGRIVDLLGEGDTFGHVSVLSGLPPALSARAAEETVCYRLPDPRTVLNRPDALRLEYYGVHLARSRFTAVGGGGLRDRAQLPVRGYVQPVVTCAPDDTVAEVAALVDAARQSCAVVIFPDGLGIVTDADFRRRVATGEVGVDAPIRVIATRPVRTVADDVVVASAFAEMLEHHVHHLVVVDSERPVGVVRVVDLASAEVRDPLVVRAAVEHAGTLEELAEACRLLPRTAIELYDTGVPAVRVGALLSAVLDAVLRRLLMLDHDVASTGTPCSWVVLGSLARREVLPGSDVDTALVWADPPPGSGPEPGRLADRVLGAAGRVLADLERVGLAKCADGANADNPRFARSLSEWKASTQLWLRDPNSSQDTFLLSTMLADSRPLTEVALGREVTDGLLSASRSPQFLRMLLQYSLSSRPPTGFVRDFVVEHSGEHRGQLNLKRGGLRPVTSLGRWVAVVTGDATGTTVDRLRRAVDARLLTRDESDTLVGAYEQVFALLLAGEVEALRAGKVADTYLAPQDLDSLTRRHLRESFRAIAHVQSRLESVWTNRASG